MVVVVRRVNDEELGALGQPVLRLLEEILTMPVVRRVVRYQQVASL